MRQREIRGKYSALSIKKDFQRLGSSCRQWLIKRWLRQSDACHCMTAALPPPWILILHGEKKQTSVTREWEHKLKNQNTHSGNCVRIQANWWSRHVAWETHKGWGSSANLVRSKIIPPPTNPPPPRVHVQPWGISQPEQDFSSKLGFDWQTQKHSRRSSLLFLQTPKGSTIGHCYKAAVSHYKPTHQTLTALSDTQISSDVRFFLWVYKVESVIKGCIQHLIFCKLFGADGLQTKDLDLNLIKDIFLFKLKSSDVERTFFSPPQILPFDI